MKKSRSLRAEVLEARCMLHGESPLPSVTFGTNLGDLTIELFPDEAPATVDNFLNYVNDGDYVNAIFHRSVPDFVVQAGGFSTTTPTLCVQPCGIADINPNQFDSIPTDDPVVNEFGMSNLRGTVAMAKLGNDPNSATSQWFVNVVDNTGLDTNNGGFTVFGQVMDMTTPDAINDLSTSNLSSLGFPFAEFPVNNNEGILEAVTILSVSGTAIVGGTVFHDLDGDGNFDGDEGGLIAAEVFLDANDNGVLDAGEESTTTDDRGRYHFLVEPAPHVVRALPYQADYTATTDLRAVASVTEIGREVGPDFGIQYVGKAWHNPVSDTDVDAINGVTPLDGLLVINELTDREFSDPQTGQLPEANTSSPIRFLDVFENNVVAPLDALLVINDLDDVAAVSMSSTGSTETEANMTPLVVTSRLADANDPDEADETEAASLLDEFFASLGNS